MAVIDTNGNCTSHIAELRARDVTAVGRYYSSRAWKRLTRTEAVALSAAGIELFVVFEDSGDPTLTVDRGVHDAQIALAQAKGVGQPEGSAIYFAMEHLPHGYTASHVPGIKRYFNGVRQVLAPGFKIGVYSDGVVCAALLDSGLCDYAWLSASTAFEGSRAFDASGRWALAQRRVDLDWDGLSVDTNDSKPDFGGFSVAPPNAMHAIAGGAAMAAEHDGVEAAAALPAGWTFVVERIREELRPGKSFRRTVGRYQVFRDGVPVPGLSGATVERQGPGDNTNVGKQQHRCIEAGNYPLNSHNTENYATVGYDSTGEHPRPSIEVGNTDKRTGILIHPAGGYGSTIGCVNLASTLANAAADIDLADSTRRVVAVIKDLKGFNGGSLPSGDGVAIANAHLVMRDAAALHQPVPMEGLAPAAMAAPSEGSYFVFAASEAWGDLAADLRKHGVIGKVGPFNGDNAQRRYALGIISKLAAAAPAPALAFGFDAGDVSVRDPDTDLDYDKARDGPYTPAPQLDGVLAAAREKGRTTLYVEGPGGATGKEWSPDEVLRTLKRGAELVVENPGDPELAGLKNALGTIDFEKLKKDFRNGAGGSPKFRNYLNTTFRPRFLPEWRKGAWWRVTREQLERARADGFVAAEIDNLDSIFATGSDDELVAANARRSLLRFFKDTYQPGVASGVLPQLIMKNLGPPMLELMKAEAESGLDLATFFDVHIFETNENDTDEHRAVREGTEKLGKTALFSFDTDRYHAFGPAAAGPLPHAGVAADAAGAPHATLVGIDGTPMPLELIAPLADTASTLAGLIPRIVELASASSIARYEWRQRGVAPIGYTAGMSVAYAAAYARLKAHDPVADRMARVQGDASTDALAWYDEELSGIGMLADTAQERLRRLYVLLLGLGMRESSGRYCEGRDRSANNTGANTAEAGLFQSSFDLVMGKPELLDVFQHYLANPGEGLLDVFKKGVTPKPRDLENFGPPTSQGFKFQKLSKECPVMVVEITALGLRRERSHWGPINRHAAEVRTSARDLLVAVERLVDENPQHGLMPVAGGPLAVAAPMIARADALSRADIARHYMEPVPTPVPVNRGLTSAREPTMVSLLGSPALPLTHHGQNERASPLVKRNLIVQRMSPLFRLTGLKPAVGDVKAVLQQVFASHPELEQVLSTEGMLSVRLRNPTTGTSTRISNHAWGTAVDFKIVGFDAPGNTGGSVPRFVALLIPLFNATGWYSGIAFHDSMHFEVSEERIRAWVDDHTVS